MKRRQSSSKRRELNAAFESDRERLFALCFRMTMRHEDAEDALHDTWLAACRTVESFRGEASLSTWLYRIAIRCSTRRRAQRRPGPLEFEPAAPDRDDVDAREKLRALLAGLDALSVEHRTVLALSAVEGLRAAEISTILEIPEGTVWSRLSQARKTLRETMGAS